MHLVCCRKALDKIIMWLNRSIFWWVVRIVASIKALNDCIPIRITKVGNRVPIIHLVVYVKWWTDMRISKRKLPCRIMGSIGIRNWRWHNPMFSRFDDIVWPSRQQITSIHDNCAVDRFCVLEFTGRSLHLEAAFIILEEQCHCTIIGVGANHGFVVYIILSISSHERDNVPTQHESDFHDPTDFLGHLGNARDEDYDRAHHSTCQKMKVSIRDQVR